MAKRPPRRTAGAAATVKRPPLNERDKKTMGQLRGLADDVTDTAKRKREPHLDIPARALRT